MKCPSCRHDKPNEYFHVLTLDPTRDSYRFNYCCSDCLAEHLRVPRHIRFQFSEEDKEEIRRIVKEEIKRTVKNSLS